MIDNKKVIVCIPSGRRRCLSMLLDCLEKESCIDEIHLWENTNDEQDLEFISKYESSTYKAKVIRIEERVGHDICGRVSSFYYHYAEGFDDDTVFLKIDDDVVWIEEGAIESIVKFTINNPKYLVVFMNTINCPLVDHLHQRFGIYPDETITMPWDCCSIAWHDAGLAQLKHMTLIENINNKYIDVYKFNRFECRADRVSINLICWNHNSFNYLDIHDDEHDLGVRIPAENNKLNCIFGEKLAAHLSFSPQHRNGLDEDKILSLYAEINK